MNPTSTASVHASTRLGHRVLVVEDDRQNRDLLRDVLADESYDVTTAADGVEALKRVGEAPPFDLILLDLRLPALSGYAVLRALRAMPDACVPVILVTAATPPVGDAARALAQAVLRKPFEIDELLGVVAQYAGSTVVPASASPTQ